MAKIGKIKKTTEEILDDALKNQKSHQKRRRAFARRFLKSKNIYAKPKVEKRRNPLAAYWFPILCAIVVLVIAVWTIWANFNRPAVAVSVHSVPQPIAKVIDENKTPTFDIVRIEPNGNMIIAGQYLPNKAISIVINKKTVATLQTDSRGDFVYAPTTAMNPGNYTVYLADAESEIQSENKVFIYVSERGHKNSLSLLMTKSGSTLMQSPILSAGDLNISKIDYLDTGRIVITGDALPRLRVSLSLNDEYMGFARVSDYKHFGLGADVGELESGREYNLAVRLHDGDGKVVATFSHKFTMPIMTGDEDTFYTVRRGDCLWIIARNFLRRGILFSIIADKNNITNPDLIFPKQVLSIPVS